ncbi:hypothetical protein NL676_035475 [Syzygium grande]|nr:hypothetical protein NL676_035475 [Syzygium grande]
MATLEENNNVKTPETQPNKRRKKKSIVWEHFTIETVSPGCRRACCKQCKQSFAYSTGSKVAGTSHLKRHIAKGTCPALLRNQDKNQITPYSAPGRMGSDPPKRRYRTSAVPLISFDQDQCRHEIAKMIIMHDYPLHMVEHPGFVTFVQNLQPRLLNIVMEPFSALSHAVATCLADWNLENKLFSVTFNQPLTEAARENLKPFLAIKNPHILNGQLLISNCVARTLTAVAKGVLGAGEGIVKKIRNSVKYVKTSDSHEEKFIDLKQQLQVPSERSLSLDDQTQWNTTYEMLVAASELKEVFSCLDTSDPDYKQAPTLEEWKQVETLCTYLKPVYEAAIILTTTTGPTAVTFFHEVWKIQADLARAVTSEDPFISDLTKPMLEKIDKYWKDCSLVLAMAVVMDPRFKMKLVEFSFTKVFGEDAPNYVKIVDEGIHELFLEYVSLPLPLTPTYAEEGHNGNKMEESPQGGHLLTDHGLTDFDMYIMETSGQQMKSELDQYLDETLLPRVQEFDVLGWWKLNKLKYPTLSKMARDILSIPVSTVLPDSVFDTAPKEMDRYRCSLRPDTVEALLCTKDWLQYGSSQISNALISAVSLRRLAARRRRRRNRFSEVAGVCTAGVVPVKTLRRRKHGQLSSRSPAQSARRRFDPSKGRHLTAMDLSSFKQDVDELINEFAQGGSRALADMKRIWLSRKFSYIYEARPSSNLTFFMQTLYSQSIGHMVSSESLSRRLGGLYCLYCLYETQPFKPPYRIYLSLGELKNLKASCC